MQPGHSSSTRSAAVTDRIASTEIRHLMKTTPTAVHPQFSRAPDGQDVNGKYRVMLLRISIRVGKSINKIFNVHVH